MTNAVLDVAQDVANRADRPGDFLHKIAMKISPTPAMISAGAGVACEHALGDSLDDLVTQVYLAMVLTMFRENPRLRLEDS